MGCHTWFYKKIILKEIETEKMIISIKNHTVDCIKHLDIETKREEFKDLLNWYKDFYEKIDYLSGNQLIAAYLSSLNINYNEIDGVFYEQAEYHDLFRHNDYDAQNLYSYDETISFIQKHKCVGDSYFSEEKQQIITKEPDLEKIKKFWEENPDGVIEFG